MLVLWLACSFDLFGGSLIKLPVSSLILWIFLRSIGLVILKSVGLVKFSDTIRITAPRLGTHSTPLALKESISLLPGRSSNMLIEGFCFSAKNDWIEPVILWWRGGSNLIWSAVKIYG